MNTWKCGDGLRPILSKTARSAVFFFLAASFISTLVTHTYAIGCGGLLVRVPYAKVFLDGKQQAGWQAYIHPTEGSWLVISPDKKCVAMDKSKRLTSTVEFKDIKATENIDIIDVPEKTPEKHLAERPVFLQKSASTILENGSRLKIEVDR